MNAFEVLVRYQEAFRGGLQVTLALFSVACLLGTLLGLLLAWTCKAGPSIWRRIFEGMAFSVTAIPALVILFWFHFPLQAMLGIVIPPFGTAAATLVLINALGTAKLLLDAIDEFPTQYVQAAKVCGMDSKSIAIHVQAPLLLRMALPRWLDLEVVIFQSTIFASLISVEEVFRVAQRVNASIYQPIAIYTAMALVFLFTTGPVLWIAKQLRTRFFRDFSEK